MCIVKSPRIGTTSSIYSVLCLTIGFLFFGLSSHASVGTINPTNNVSKFFKAQLESDSSIINMGWYDGGGSVGANIPVSITDTEMLGFGFSENYGWINFNCANTTTALPAGICGTSDFKVENINGVLTGYAWGENLGWINFGPAAPGQTYPLVEINYDVAGEFVGYAWSQNAGWILFDCTLSNDSCTRTDWNSDCNDGVDNDSDGFADFPLDTECSSTSDASEGIYQCSDGADNDSDGLTDSPADPQCTSATDNKEASGQSSSTSGQSSGVDSDTTSDPNVSETGDSEPTDSTGDSDSPSTSNSSSGGSNSSGIFPDENPPETIDIPEEAYEAIETDALAFVSVENIKNIVGDILSTNQRTSVANTISSAGVALAVGGTLPTLIGIVGVSEVALIPVRLASLFLSALGIRRKKWGVVYDAVTKQPLDPVYVILQDLAGNEVATSITDLDGRFGFLVKKGTYKIVAGKTNYEFPAKDMVGKSSDGIYNDVYYGQEIVVPEDGAVLAFNIPMTPIGFDWNEAAKREQKVMRFYTKRKRTFLAISQALYYFGFVLSLFVAIVQPKPYTFVILGFYGLVFLLHRLGIRERVYGTVVDKVTGFGVPFSVVRIYSEKTGVQIKNCVADASGKYLCLVGNGVYKLVLEKKLPDGTYQKVQERSNVVVKKGVLSTTFEL